MARRSRNIAILQYRENRSVYTAVVTSRLKRQYFYRDKISRSSIKAVIHTHSPITQVVNYVSAYRAQRARINSAPRNIVLLTMTVCVGAIHLIAFWS